MTPSSPLLDPFLVFCSGGIQLLQPTLGLAVNGGTDSLLSPGIRGMSFSAVLGEVMEMLRAKDCCSSTLSMMWR